uniref:Uncharacterized protein n=1 Tax=Anopheles atroparvus TaxID=41427 RepID=A0AAG5CY32_ANOAO
MFVVAEFRRGPPTAVPLSTLCLHAQHRDPSLPLLRAEFRWMLVMVPPAYQLLRRLEQHTMRILVGAQREHRLQIAGDEPSILVGLDCLQHGRVDGLLVGLALLRRHVLELLLGEDVALSARLTLRNHPSEVAVVDVLRHLEALQIQAGLGGDDVVLRNATQRAGVQLERSRHQQQSRLQDLQQHHPLALMATGKQDQHLAWLQRLAGVSLVVAEQRLGRALLHVALRRQVALVLPQHHRALTAVLGTADLLHNRNGDLRLLRLLHRFHIFQLELLTALGEFTGRITAHSVGQQAVAEFPAFFALFALVVRLSRGDGLRFLRGHPETRVNK